MGRSFRNQRNDETRNRRLERIAERQTRSDKKNFSDDDRIRSHNERGFLEKFKKRNDPDVIRERIAKKKLSLTEQQIDTKKKLDKAKRPKSSWLQPQPQSRASRGGRSRSGRQSAPRREESNSILDSRPGEGLNDLFGFSSQSSSSRKKSDGLDGLKSLFG
ncbi:hypothetical protein [Nitrosopumilus spindle-shaped virus]|uniref:Uncharacterized protein n=1 Tax=Nitrosopumilus spindle-shaped virus TaxID=2508184 RepID=A0A514K388_9VIRU|nr:hypothetical protein [Nitrosopumilus spindle-shaped virus]